MADTSYSDMTAADNRGQAVSAVVVDVGVGREQTRVYGRTDTGVKFRYELGDTGGYVESRDPDYGELGSGRFVKAKLERDEFLLCHVKVPRRP